jgi:hypothetical protein
VCIDGRDKLSSMWMMGFYFEPDLFFREIVRLPGYMEYQRQLFHIMIQNF